MSLITAVVTTDDGLLIQLGDAATTLSWRWVRDHGEDERSLDPITRQRRIYALDPDGPSPALSCELSQASGAPVVAIAWPDSPEKSWISVATLTALLTPTAPTAPTRWHSADATAVHPGNVAAVLADDAALRAWLDDIDRYGFGLLNGFAGGHGAVTSLASRIGGPMSTVFGSSWDLAADVDIHDDSAYTQTFLAPHTDGTYMHNAPGLQMFCCTERDGTGGESIVVDGFAIAETLRTAHPDHYDTLTKVSVPGHYIEHGVELRTSRPAIRLDPAGVVVQVSMNNYDRSPMLLEAPEMGAFYAAYGALHDLANDQDRWKSIRLEAGDVLITDNWRVLHGRRAYTGGRRFVGCYIDHGDFESRLRTVGSEQHRSRLQTEQV